MRITQVFIAVACAAAVGLGISPTPARAVITAGTLFVDLDASHPTAGSVLWHNSGTIGDFARVGIPSVVSRDSAQGVLFNATGTLDSYESLVSAPAGVTGVNPSRTIEAWVWNPGFPDEETIVSWGRRGGPDGTNMSFNYGGNGLYGAVGHWGCCPGPDIGWNNGGGAPSTASWHHLAYTFSDVDFTTRVYIDGALANSEVLSPGLINTHTAPKISLAQQHEGDGVSFTGGLRGTMVIGKMRIHDGVLSSAAIQSNYLEELPSFPAALPPSPEILPAGPIHRWTFNGDTLDTGSSPTLPGTLVGGATVNASRVTLDGSDDHVSLGSNDIAAIGATHGAVTLEGWATTDATTGAWARLVDLGNTNGGGLGTNYVFISPAAGTGTTRGAISDADPGFNHEDIVEGPIQTNGLERHYALVLDDTNNLMALYIDGLLVSQNTMTIPLSAVSPALGYFGKSTYTPDSYLRGNINEMRIYDYALTANHVLGNYENGPDFINSVPEPSSFVLAGLGLVGLISVARRRRS